tara:strand:- start:54 stop:317 length:264 start_codon:yes stop_codon:yes gene_type:complete
MTTSGYILIGMLTFTIVGIVAIVRSERKKRTSGRYDQGTAPGHGASTQFHSMHGANGSQHSFISRHTRGPQTHARGLVPTRAKKRKS